MHRGLIIERLAVAPPLNKPDEHEWEFDWKTYEKRESWIEFPLSTLDARECFVVESFRFKFK